MAQMHFAEYQNWLNSSFMPADLLEDLNNMANNPSAINDAFYRSLSFGTGGLRGVLGAGSNRMNIFTVAQATRALGKYLMSLEQPASCAIAYDSRIHSEDFAQLVAAILANQGLKVYIYPELMPTPLLSYAVRKLNCTGGIMITASHNPAKYNGYKVYGSDGGQITLDAAQQIYALIQKEDLLVSSFPNYRSALNTGKIEIISQNLVEEFLNDVLSLSLYPIQKPIRVVYSPLNGTGNKPVRALIQRLPQVNLYIVAEQEFPDGHFPTCPKPNPEYKETLALAEALAIKTNSGLFFATDPDCDRIGIGLITEQGTVYLNGNQTGVLLFDFICKQRLLKASMPALPVAVKTIVTSNLAESVAAKYGVQLIDVLTGFKYIGEQISLLSEKGEESRYLFGFEESYGYLSGAHVRDKDAVNAALIILEMYAYYQDHGLDLSQAYHALQMEHGFEENQLLSFAFEGESGAQKLNTIMEWLRSSDSIGPFCILQKIDYRIPQGSLPKSDVLTMKLENKMQVIIRPSGTEPLLKLYLTCNAESAETSKQLIEKLARSCEALITEF